jgi:hypothetical protein
MIVERMKIPSTDEERSFANYIFNTCLIPRICKGKLKFTRKEIKGTILIN